MTEEKKKRWSQGKMKQRIRSLELELQRHKQMAGMLGDNCRQMGEYAEKMMIASYNVLEMAHKQRKKLRLTLSLGIKPTAEVKKTLESICDQVAEFAADWKRTENPNFPQMVVGATGAPSPVDDTTLPEVGVKTSMVPPEPPSREMSIRMMCTCGWTGTVGECPTVTDDKTGKTDKVCPSCGKPVWGDDKEREPA